MVEIAQQYIPEASRALFIKAAGPDLASNVKFAIDANALSAQLKMKSIALESGITIKGPVEIFDQAVNIKQSGGEEIEITIHGKLTSSRLVPK
jgi:hypothetical protein